MPDWMYTSSHYKNTGKSLPGTTTVRASHLRVGDQIGTRATPSRTVVAVQPSRDHAREVYVQFADGNFDWLNIDERVTVAGDLSECERELLHSTITPVNQGQRPGGNPMSNRTDDRRTFLQESLEAARFEIAFLNHLPAEPDVDAGEIEPTVVLVNLIHKETGEVTSSHVIRSYGISRTGGGAWGMTDRGYSSESWSDLLHAIFRPDRHFEVRLLNPGTVLYTTVPQAPAPKAARRTPVKRTAPAAKRTR